MKKILWFIAGDILPDQIEKAAKDGLTIRSLDAYHDGDFIEVCDGVCGAFPHAYGCFEEFALSEAVVEYEAPKSRGRKTSAEAAGASVVEAAGVA